MLRSDLCVFGFEGGLDMMTVACVRAAWAERQLSIHRLPCSSAALSQRFQLVVSSYRLRTF